MNPIIGLLIIGLITVGLVIAPSAVLYGGWGLIALALLGTTALLVVFWWKVIASWIKDFWLGN